MVDVKQVTVQVQVLVTAVLNRRIRRLVRHSAGWEAHFGVQAKGRNGESRQGLGGELGFIDDDFLDLGVRRLSPGWGKRCHCDESGGNW